MRERDDDATLRRMIEAGYCVSLHDDENDGKGTAAASAIRRAARRETTTTTTLRTTLALLGSRCTMFLWIDGHKSL